LGSQSSAICLIRGQVIFPFRLRRDSEHRQRSTERSDRRRVSRYGVAGKVASDNLRQPAPLLGDRLVPSHVLGMLTQGSPVM